MAEEILNEEITEIIPDINPIETEADAKEKADAIAEAVAIAVAEVKDEMDSVVKDIKDQAKAEAKKIVADAKAKAKAKPKVVITDDKPPTGTIVAAGGLYKATRKCTYGIRLYDPEGAGLETEKGDVIPHHFAKVKRFVEVIEGEE